ncbi:hypothetical protein B0H19DRAFT_1247785 [Mycena capillaripes]|nr:hypothetical protein B0H19DRAFT_1247785 [Mycena capillaripes]
MSRTLPRSPSLLSLYSQSPLPHHTNTLLLSFSHRSKAPSKRTPWAATRASPCTATTTAMAAIGRTAAHQYADAPVGLNTPTPSTSTNTNAGASTSGTSQEWTRPRTFRSVLIESDSCEAWELELGTPFAGPGTPS